MKKNFLLKCLLAGGLSSVGAFAEMSVVKSNSELTITSTLSGTVIAKVVGPNDEVLVNEKYEGSSFSWTPYGIDGAYRYEVRVVAQKEIDTDATENETNQRSSMANEVDYAGGSVELRNGQIVTENKYKG